MRASSVLAPPVRLAALLALAACAKKREPAPTEMTDLAVFLFANWEDAEALPEAIDNMGAWLADHVDDEDAEKGFALPDLTEEDVASVTHPDAPLDPIGAAGAARSAFDLDHHAGVIPLADQVWSNPGTYKEYVRDLTEGTKAEFEAGEGILRTQNAVVTSKLGVTIPYTLMKDYRWVEGETHRAILARSWVEEVSCNDGGDNCVEHTYSVDLTFADDPKDSDGDGSPDPTARMTCSWSQVTSPIPLGDDLLTASLADGIQDVFRATDEFLAAR